jgi:hypothetical protein
MIAHHTQPSSSHIQVLSKTRPFRATTNAVPLPSLRDVGQQSNNATMVYVHPVNRPSTIVDSISSSWILSTMGSSFLRDDHPSILTVSHFTVFFCKFIISIQDGYKYTMLNALNELDVPHSLKSESMLF